VVRNVLVEPSTAQTQKIRLPKPDVGELHVMSDPR
jgi:hypothetical protein